MSDIATRVPAEARWTIASQALTGAVVVSAKALQDVLGQESFHEAWSQIWSQLGTGAKQIADGLGLAGDDAESVAEAATFATIVAMGPEVKTEVVEATAERAVIRSIECPYWNRMKELGISDDICSVADPAYFDALAKTLNPKVTVSLTKARPLGDPTCEWVYTLGE